MSRTWRRLALLLIPAFLLTRPAAADLPQPGRADDATTGRKYALLVGVRNYNKDQLRNLRFTENDVSDLAQVLRDAGYKRVVLMTQTEAAARGDNDLLPEGEKIRRQLKALLDDRKPGDTILVAFSGHGVQFRDDKGSYFCPMDARLGDPKTLVSLAQLYRVLEDSAAATKVLLVDACRNDPQAESSKSGDKVKLESVTRPQSERPPGGVGALFSCSEGQRSYESEKLGHGVFFHYVIEGLKGKAANKKGEVGLEGLSQYVKDEVPDAVKDVSLDARQLPQLVGDLSGAAPLVTRGNLDEITNTLGMTMKRIEPGAFTMGSPDAEEGRYRDEGPRHEVEITKPFYMGVYPVTVGQFKAFVKGANDYRTEAEADGKGGFGLNVAAGKWEQKPEYTWRHPGFEQTDAHPVVEVSWNDAQAFCNWLSKREGKTYELPTEAEWEYACRAGTKTRFWCGDADDSLKGNANIADASAKATWRASVVGARDDGYAYTSPVGRFNANPWGLYDMDGNVWQWCADRYGPYQDKQVKDAKDTDSGGRRVLRGGSWGNEPRNCRSAARHGYDATVRDNYVGLRVVLRPTAGTH